MPNGLDPVGLDLGPNYLHLKIISRQPKLLTNHLCNYGSMPYADHFCVFKDISYLELWQPFRQAERNHLCTFGRGCYEEQFYEIILNMGQWFRRCHLKDFLSGALAALLFGAAEPFVQF